MYGYHLNENGSPRSYGGAPADYQTAVFARKSTHSSSAPRKVGPSSSPSAPSRPTWKVGYTGRPARARPRPATRSPRSRPVRCRPLPRPPSFNERHISDKPTFVRRRPRLDGAHVNRLRTIYRSRMESLLAVDDLVRGLVHELRATGELDRTYIVFTSDNGFMLGQHRVKGKSKAYEESVRVPPGDPRPGLAGGTGARPAGGEHRPGSHHPRCHRRAAATPDGRDLCSFPWGRSGCRRTRSLVLEYLVGRDGYSSPSGPPTAPCTWSTATASASCTT